MNEDDFFTGSEDDGTGTAAGTFGIVFFIGCMLLVFLGFMTMLGAIGLNLWTIGGVSFIVFFGLCLHFKW